MADRQLISTEKMDQRAASVQALRDAGHIGSFLTDESHDSRDCWCRPIVTVKEVPSAFHDGNATRTTIKHRTDRTWGQFLDDLLSGAPLTEGPGQPAGPSQREAASMEVAR